MKKSKNTKIPTLYELKKLCTLEAIEKMAAKESRPQIRLYFDCETYTNTFDKDDENLIIKPYLIGCFSPGVLDFVALSAEDFINKLIELDKDYKLTLVGHNVQYDISSTIGPYFIEDPRFEGHEFKLKLNDIEKFIAGHFKSEILSFKIADTLLWDRTKGLAKWAEELKGEYEKGSIDYKKKDVVIDWNKRIIHYKNELDQPKEASLDEEIAYLKNDVMLVFEIEKYIYQVKQKTIAINENLLKVDGRYLLRQSGGLTQSSWGKKLMNACINDSLSVDIFFQWDYFDQLYRCKIDDNEACWEQFCSSIGGFTAYNPSQLEWASNKPDIKTFDIVSSYPDEMWKGLPYGEILTEKPEGKENVDYVVFYRCHLTHIKWKGICEGQFSQELFPISRLKKFKKVFGTDHVWMPKKYYELIIEYTETDLKIVGTFYQKFGTHARGYIENLYKLKNSEDKVIAKIAKMLLNSPYGKTIEKPIINSKWYDGKEYTETHLEYEEIDFRCYTTGVWIVMMSRLKLLNAIIEQIKGGNIFLYCDTDSIKYVENNKLENSILYKNKGNNLGQWKFEGEFTHFRNNAKAKKYLLFDDTDKTKPIHFKLSGISNKIVNTIKKCFDPYLFWDMLDVNNNYLFKSGKTKAYKAGKYKQFFIVDIDVAINPKVGVTHIISIENDELVVEKVNSKK